MEALGADQYLWTCREENQISPVFAAPDIFAVSTSRLTSVLRMPRSVRQLARSYSDTQMWGRLVPNWTRCTRKLFVVSSSLESPIILNRPFFIRHLVDNRMVGLFRARAAKAKRLIARDQKVGSARGTR